MALRQAREILLRIFELLLVGAVQSDDDIIQIRHFAQFIDDIFERGTFEFRKEAGQDQGHGIGLAEPHQVGFQRFHRPAGQIMKCRNATVLMKISHICPSV